MADKAKWKRGTKDGWSVDGPGSFSSVTIVESGRKAPVALVVSAKAFLDDAELDAYADLIAAAPDLLAALEKCAKAFEQPLTRPEEVALRAARAAIAKATGQEA
ncbi:hypothetical protein [Azospirillum aestuarii]|uniref:hypothetical protein n=1 Tax=Azospirillum aestuarii TaxID=2802052 RepID=UPI004054F4BA